MLVRGGVEDSVGLILLEDPGDPVGITDIGDDGREGDLREELTELVGDLEDLILRVVKQHEQRRLEGGDLPADLRANRPAGPGDEYDLPGHDAPDAGEISGDGFTPQEVFDLDGPELRDLHSPRD